MYNVYACVHYLHIQMTYMKKICFIHNVYIYNYACVHYIHVYMHGVQCTLQGFRSTHVFMINALIHVHVHVHVMYNYMYIIYCKSGNFGQRNIFGKWEKTRFGKKKFSVLHQDCIGCAFIRMHTWRLHQ